MALVVFALAVMLRGGSMRLCSALVMLGRSRVGFLRHFRSLADEICPLRGTLCKRRGRCSVACIVAGQIRLNYVFR